MEAQLSEIKSRVRSVKETLFSAEADPYSLVSPSAYDTAWLAMIPGSHQPLKPMFSECLNWVLNNQNESGFWGDCDGQGKPTMECLTSTLACIIALKTWNIGTEMINKGLAYINSIELDKLLKETKDHCPICFSITFPGMVEIALDRFSDLRIDLDVSNLSRRRNQILKTGTATNHQLISYIEALPPRYAIDRDVIINHLDKDGSLFQSPSATAFAFMSTGNSKSLRYLQSLVHRFSNKGVPASYPIDEELIKLCVVNHVQRMGLSEHFAPEIDEILEQVHKNCVIINGKAVGEPYNSAASIHQKLLKDSLAFRLLRMNGYDVSPWKLCMFLYDNEVREFIENNYRYFAGVMLNVHQATDVMFLSETELQEARNFSRKLMEKSIFLGAVGDQNPSRRLIEHELDIPWMARLEHLEHRIWIEENKTGVLWRGKTSFQRLSRLHNDKLLNLATQNYQFRQVVYKTELDELKRWSKDHGLADMGFGRERTTYCYFAVSASCSLPYDSDIRIITAKSAIVITVADDFFDMKGSDLNELRTLTDAVKRWDGKRLRGHSKVIFDALDNLVSDMAVKYFKRKGIDIESYFRAIWHETFVSWLTETEWGRTESRPSSMDEYLRVGMVSIAVHTILLPALCFLNHNSLSHSQLFCAGDYESMTKLVMIITRLLNDIQSYQKEKVEGTVNSVLLYMENNPEADIEEAITSVREILRKKKGEFLEQVLMDKFSDFPKEGRFLHLSCLRVFQMFFDSKNRYDSDTEMLDDIAKAIYIPLESGLINSKKLRGSTMEPLVSLPSVSNAAKCSLIKYHCGSPKPYKNLIKSIGLPIQRRSGPSTWRSGDRNPIFSPDYCMKLSYI